MHIYKKRPNNGGEFVYVWIAVDRESAEIIDFEIGDMGVTYAKLANRIRLTCKIEHLCTDNYAIYKQQVISKIHHATKSETSLVECEFTDA